MNPSKTLFLKNPPPFVPPSEGREKKIPPYNPLKKVKEKQKP